MTLSSIKVFRGTLPGRALFAAVLVALLAATGLTACGGGPAGGIVTMLGPWTGAEEESFRAVIAPFERSTGIKVRYEGARDLDAVLTSRLQNDTPPDLVALSTPGELRELSAGRVLHPLGDVLDRAQMSAGYGPAWLRLGQAAGGRQDAVIVKAAVKGLVWYSTGSFRQEGYRPPTDWPGLLDLAGDIRAGGGTPWCLGLEASSTSGWPGTDWIEDILLHQSGPAVYRRWADGTLAWTAPEVRRAWQTWGELVAGPGAVAGGPLGALLTNFGDAGNGMFAAPPRCMLDHEASFITGFYRRGSAPVVAGRDAGFFPLPAPDPRYASAREVAGDLVGMIRDTPAAGRLVRYLTTPEAQRIWVGRGGTISPNRAVGLDAYPDDASRRIAQLAAAATAVDFDASDLMPVPMQTAYYQAVLAYVAEPARLDGLLADLDRVRVLAS